MKSLRCIINSYTQLNAYEEQEDLNGNWNGIFYDKLNSILDSKKI